MSAHSPALSTSQRLDSPADHGDTPGFPLFPLASVLLATLVLVTALAWSGTKQDRVTAQFVQEAVRITEIRGAILRLDEALTMSARMAVATGDMAWRERYDKFAPMLDKSIADALTQVTPEIRAKVDETTRNSNDVLLRIEAAAFDAAERHDFAQAARSMNGDEYRQHKAIYASGMQILADALDSRMYGQQERIEAAAEIKLLLSATGGVVIVVAWIYLARTFTRWRRRSQSSEARVRVLAQYDPLTSLPNRILFKERLEQALAVARREERQVAVLWLDLDHFKEVNDTLGHPAGDILLKRVTERLSACVRETDTIARFGGDEFVVVQSGPMHSDAAAVLARRMIDALAEPFELDGHEVVSGVSIGIAMSPNDGSDPDLLLKSADTALFRVKAEGRGGFRFFEEEMNARLQARKAMEHDLRRALTEEQFELHYQPQVELATGRVRGVEALLRWRHPRRGWILPMEFIPLAEETGLIAPIGEWVLRTACRQAAIWPELRMAVNLSAVQFRLPGLDRVVAEVLAETGLPPARLELEITETVLLHDTDTTLATLLAIKEAGVRVAMDDFGTGYCSLSYLRRFPFDKIKIDRSFVRDLTSEVDAEAIIRAVVRLGQSLGMTTNAEGVETIEQADYLRSQGCDEVQGYHFGQPMSARDIGCLLDLPGGVASAPA